MKKTVLTLTVALATSVATLNAQNVNIPDANFKAYLVGNTFINTNGDTEIQVSEAQAFTGQITCNGINIASLTGIEAFTALTSLHCYQNPITSLNLSNNIALTQLICSNTLLTSLDVSNNTNLIALNCSYNQITSLDLSNNTALYWLHCRNNQLTTLNVTNTVLTELQCESNQITALDVSGISTLVEVICNNNQIPVLDFSNSTGFIKLLANNNQLTQLNLRNGNNTNVTSIGVNGNPNLTCVEVDDADYSLTNWGIGIGVDFAFMTGVTFSENCGGTVGINKMASQNNVSIYPNPTNGQVHFSAPTNVQLTSVTGQVIADRKNVNMLDLTNQPAGIYFVILTDNNGQVLQRSKVMKE